MLSKGVEFNDQIETLTEGKQKSMAARAKNPVRKKSLEDTVKLFIQNRNRRKTG